MMKHFTIKKDKHWSGLHFGFTLKRKVQFKAIFDESCIYSIDGIDSYDINKLYGISGALFHHIQSGRIGWRCTDGVNIDLYAYTYAFGKRVIKEDKDCYLGSVLPGEKFFCTIEDTGREYVYTLQYNLDGEKYQIREKKFPSILPYRYFLFPYFGGNKAAPHTMEIYVKRL